MTDASDDRAVLVLTAPVGRPDHVLVRLAGDLDISSLPPIEQALAAAVLAEIPALTVDLTDEGFIGVTGIGALVRAANAARERGCDFRVVGASAHLRELCGLLGVGAVLGIVEGPCR